MKMFYTRLTCIFYTIHLLSLKNAQSIMQKIESSRLKNDAVKPMHLLVIECLKDKLENVIVIREENEENPSKIQLSFEKLTLIRIFGSKNNLFKAHKRISYFTEMNETTAKRKVYPSSITVIVMSSKTALISLLNDLRESIWWNCEAHFFIINNDYIDGCKSAHEFLHTVWNFNVLSAIYICVNEQNKLFSYTFNPFDRVGSVFWKIVPSKNDDSNYWTLLVHSFDNSTYQEDINLRCNDMNLDRTKNLNHFNVKTGSYKMAEVLFYGHKIEVMNDIKLIRTCLNELNASFTLKYYKKFGVITSEGPTSYYKDIQSSLTNIVTYAGVNYFWRQHTYPHEYQGILLVTPKEIVSVWIIFFTSSMAILPLVTFLLSLGFFKLLFHKSISWSFLECLRMHTGNSTLLIAKKPFHRFLLFNLIFLIFMTNAHLQSYISAYETVPRYGFLIDSVRDLLNTNLTLYGAEYNENVLYPKQMLERFTVGNPLECVKDSNRGKKIACSIHVVDLAFQNTDNVHVAKENLNVGPAMFTVSPDWPLLARVNQILGRFAEAGIYQQLSVHYSALKIAKGIKKKDKYNSITTSQVASGFYVFLGGCGIALVSFLFELVVHKLLRCK